MLPERLLEDLGTRGVSLVVAGQSLVVTSINALTDDDRDAIRKHKLPLIRLLTVDDEPSPETDESGETPEVTCPGCAHRLPRRTCGEPVAAGLAPHFGIAWGPKGFWARCPAFKQKPPIDDDMYSFVQDPQLPPPARPLEDASPQSGHDSPVIPDVGKETGQTRHNLVDDRSTVCLAAYGYEVPGDGLMHGLDEHGSHAPWLQEPGYPFNR